MVLCSIFLCFNILGCNLFAPNQTTGGYALVVIGSKYPLLPGNNLRGTAMDGMEMAVLLKNQGYDVTYLVDDGILTDYITDTTSPKISAHIENYKSSTFLKQFSPPFQPATNSQIKTELANIRGKIKPEDTFIFYYAGHSGPSIDFDIPGLEDGFSNPDTEILQLPNYNRFNNIDTYVSDDFLALEMNKFPSETPKVVILDSCYSGGFIGQDGTQPLTGHTEDPRSQIIPNSWTGLFNKSDIIPSLGIVLSAAPEGLESRGDGDGGDANLNYDLFHGFFTYTLLEGVSNGKADTNRDGYISVSEIYNYSRFTIGRWSVVDYRPRISGGPYDIILFKSP